MRTPRLVPALAAAALLAACGRCGTKPAPLKTTGPEHGGARRPLALVDGEPIAPDALARDLADARPGKPDGGILDPALGRRLLDTAIDRVLLIREAYRREVRIGPEEVDRAVARVRAEYPGARFEELLAEQGVTEAELRSRLLEQLTVEKLLAQYASEVQVGAAEVERYYREHQEEFDEAAQVHALQIVVHTREEARRVLDELRHRTTTFGDVARRASIAPEAKLGGDLGWFGQGSGMPEVFEVCLTLPLDQVSEVTPSPYGFHLFKVVARRPARRRPFAEVSTTIRERLVREKRAQAQEQFLSALRGRASIQVDEVALEAVTR